ncbi:MAG TPA: acyltransferase [Casimicrobiaceae bacterium]|nr:acyltransferase [Casimicrobiaceae bacterium]
MRGEAARAGSGHSGNNLDLVRFVAASLVLVSHSYTLTGRGGEPSLFAYETLGGLAVAVFFIISGFLVTASWQRSPGLLAFVRNRALRIMPALIGVVTLCALVLGPVFSPLSLKEYYAHPQTRDYFLNLTFAQLNYSLPAVFAHNPFPHVVNGSLWTLPIEVTMYAVLALLGVLRLVDRKVVTVLVIALAAIWFGLGPGRLDAMTPYLPAVLPAAPTAHLALWFFSGSALWLWRDHIAYRTPVALALLALAWIVQGGSVGHAVLHVALPYALLWFAQVDVRQLGAFGRHGDFSYGIYLYAFPVQQAFASVGAAAWPLPVYVAACFVVTLACAVASWKLIEAPALRAKRRTNTSRAAAEALTTAKGGMP